MVKRREPDRGQAPAAHFPPGENAAEQSFKANVSSPSELVMTVDGDTKAHALLLVMFPKAETTFSSSLPRSFPR